jgi:hypothetical protein
MGRIGAVSVIGCLQVAVRLMADCPKPGPAESRGRVCFEALEALLAKVPIHAGFQPETMQRARPLMQRARPTMQRARLILHGQTLLNSNEIASKILIHNDLSS